MNNIATDKYIIYLPVQYNKEVHFFKIVENFLPSSSDMNSSIKIQINIKSQIKILKYFNKQKITHSAIQ